MRLGRKGRRFKSYHSDLKMNELLEQVLVDYKYVWEKLADIDIGECRVCKQKLTPDDYKCICDDEEEDART